MAFYQKGIITTANQLVADFKVLAEANGWTIDLFTTYLTYNRVHLHKGTSHFEVYATSPMIFSIVGCTGYSAVDIPTAQPGATAQKPCVALVAGQDFCIISTTGAICISYYNSSWAQRMWACIGTIQTKIGTFSDGMFCCNSYTSFLGLDWFSYTGQLYINGSWTTEAAAGGFGGSVNYDTHICAKQPMEYNAGILPVPVTLFLGLASNGTMKQPIGFAPGVFRCNGGNIYTRAEEITVGADTYLIMPYSSLNIGNISYHDLLFKLGA